MITACFINLIDNFCDITSQSSWPFLSVISMKQADKSKVAGLQQQQQQ